MKRVLQILSGLSAGGAEAMIMNIYRNIDKTKVQFDFCVFGNADGIFASDVKQFGGKIFIVPSIRNQGVKTFIESLRRIIRENGPYDVVHSHIDYLSGLALYAAKREAVKIRIAHSHNTDAITNKGKMGPILLSAVRLTIKNNATDYCACSKQAAEYMFGKTRSKRSLVINNAIDLDRFCEKKQYNSEEILRNVGIEVSQKTKIVTHVGRFVEQKNHVGLINIADKVLQKNQDVFFLLLGEGPLKKSIEELVNKKDFKNVKFLGNRKDIPEILHISDAFILPSLYEGLPVTLIEAQAMNVPCVVSDNIKRDADCGLNLISYVPLTDEETWSATIINSVSRREVRNNYNVMTECGYNIKNNVNVIEHLYQV